MRAMFRLKVFCGFMGMEWQKVAVAIDVFCHVGTRIVGFER